MSGTRQHHRRQKRTAARRCLTVSDAHMLNEQRRLPSDHSSLGLRKRKNRPKRPRMRFPTYTSADQAWRFLSVIHRSEAATAVCEWFRSHPGPKSRCSGEVLLLALCLAAETTGRALRSDVCKVINGLHSTIQHHLGVCDGTSFEPVSQSVVNRQMQRLERAPFAKIMRELSKECDDEAEQEEEEAADGTDDREDEPKASGVDKGLLWLVESLLLAAVPRKTRRKLKAVAVDGTAFPTFARVRDFRVQKDVDRAVRAALMRGESVPDDIMLGADGKLKRCPHDPEARASHRGASLATDHKAGQFTGYMVTSVAASCDYRHYGDPTTVHLRDDPGPYILSFACDPASHDRGPIARDVLLSLKSAIPAIRLVTADREFSERRASLVRPLHEHRIDMVMDFPRPATANMRIVRVGTRGELLYSLAGDFLPLWLPLEFRGPCPHKNPAARRDWHERRSRFRYVPNGPPDKHGTRQLKCPQCAGKIVGAHRTRTGKWRNRQPPGVLSIPTKQLRQWCCNGTVSVPVDDLDWWQPLPWGTGAHDSLYKWGRARIENLNGIIRNDGGLDPRSCRASGTVAHAFAFLAMALVNNVQLADADTNADPDADDVPRAELSLLCVLPASASNGSSSNGAQAALPQRAPP